MLTQGSSVNCYPYNSGIWKDTAAFSIYSSWPMFLQSQSPSTYSRHFARSNPWLAGVLLALSLAIRLDPLLRCLCFSSSTSGTCTRISLAITSLQCLCRSFFWSCFAFWTSFRLRLWNNLALFGLTLNIIPGGRSEPKVGRPP